MPSVDPTVITGPDYALSSLGWLDIKTEKGLFQGVGGSIYQHR